MGFKYISLQNGSWSSIDLGSIIPNHIAAGDTGISYGDGGIYFRGGGGAGTGNDGFYFQQLINNTIQQKLTSQFNYTVQVPGSVFGDTETFYAFAPVTDSSIMCDGGRKLFIGKNGITRDPNSNLSYLLIANSRATEPQPIPDDFQHIAAKGNIMPITTTIGPLNVVRGQNGFVFYVVPNFGIIYYCLDDTSYLEHTILDPYMPLQKLFTLVNKDKRVEIFYAGADGQIYHAWQARSEMSSLSIGPVPLKDAFVSVNDITITGAENKDGRLEIFYRGTNGYIYHMWQTMPPNDKTNSPDYGNGGWSEPQLLIDKQLTGKGILACNNLDGNIIFYYVDESGFTQPSSPLLESLIPADAINKNVIMEVHQRNEGGWSQSAPIANLFFDNDMVYISGSYGSLVVSS